MGAWLALLIVGMTVGSGVMARFSTAMDGARGSESERVHHLVHELRPHGRSVVAVVEADVDDPVVREQVSAAAAEIRRADGVAAVLDRYSGGKERLTSTDGQASLVVVVLEGDLEHVAEHRVAVTVRERMKEITAASVKVGGPTLVDEEFAEAIERDLRKGESMALPVAFVAMIFIFGGVLVAGLPLLVALVSVAGMMLVLLGLTHVTDVSAYALNVVFMFGIGLGIDYGLLVVSRVREEKAAGLDVAAAIERTVATAGRTVAFSAMTVAVALCGLFAFGTPVFESFAIAGIGVVLLSMAASVTFLPALLAVTWKRVKPARSRAADDGFFYRLAAAVQRRALPVAGGVAVLLIALGAPFLGARFENGDARSLPSGSEARAVALTVAERFPSHGADPVLVVAEAAQDQPALIRYMAALAERDGVAAVSSWTAEEQGVTVVEVVPEGASQGDHAQRLVRQIRDDRPGFATEVGGTAALLVDTKANIASRLPIAFAVIAAATFVLLFLMTGSLAVPLKAIAMNVLSLGATFGGLILVFQNGHLSGVLGFEPVGSVDLFMPVLIFIFAFGLSMDYEVFLLARIKEAYDETGDNDLAVRLGLQRSGRIVTSAALLIVVVFAGFASGEVLGIKQLGFGLALAVIVDATVVRSVLVPATMQLLGDRNWWAPRPLRRLHDRFGISEAEPVVVRAAEMVTA
ncbi:MAG TPA: MMPL family transporter [Acidimicrobiales bacterium]|nr:MMPL family transporter [Acidimicrobiales bacterium]